MTNLASLQSDNEPDFTATPQRAQRQPYEFTPISQLPGGAPSTGEEGGEAPPSSVTSAPLISPSAQSRATLLDRLNRPNGPGDLSDAFRVAKEGAGAANKGLQGGRLLERLLEDASFSPAAVDAITHGGFFTGADLSSLAGGAEQSLAGDAAGVASEGAGGLSSSLSAVAPYVQALIAALNIGQIATNDQLQDDQKAVGAGGAAAAAIAPAAAGAAASAAGLGAGAAAGAAGAAAPVGMILAMIAQHIMEAMYDVPHDVREALDYFHSRGGLSGFREAVDQSFTLDDLWKNVLRQSSGYMGGGYPGQQSAFITSLGQPGNQRYVATGSRYPVVTMEDLLHDPEHTNVSWQHGLSDKYLAPTNDLLTKQFQSRLKLLGRAQEGDPEARVAVELARARYAAWMRQRQEIEANYQEAQRRQSLEMVSGGDNGGASASGGPGAL